MQQTSRDPWQLEAFRSPLKGRGKLCRRHNRGSFRILHGIPLPIQQKVVRRLAMDHIGKGKAVGKGKVVGLPAFHIPRALPRLRLEGRAGKACCPREDLLGLFPLQNPLLLLACEKMDDGDAKGAFCLLSGQRILAPAAANKQGHAQQQREKKGEETLHFY